MKVYFRKFQDEIVTNSYVEIVVEKEIGFCKRTISS